MNNQTACVCERQNWREEPHKAISSNSMKDQDYLGNGFKGTTFGIGCRTGTPRPATGAKGI